MDFDGFASDLRQAVVQMKRSPPDAHTILLPDSEVDVALQNLKRDKKYAKATHNSWGVLLDGVPLKSDDGESGAGMVILRMLERAERTGELIIVTRWYGGKHLGGDRFRHVQEATRLYLDHPAP